MKKVLLWIGGAILGLMGLAYILIFSPVGNAIFKPILESKINKHSPIPLKLSRFSLGLNTLEIYLQNKPNLDIKLQGTHNLLLFKVDMALKINCNDASLFSDHIGVEQFYIDTTIQGRIYKTLQIHTISDIGKSDTDIHITLENLNPSSIQANIKDMHLNTILAIFGKKPYISGILNIKTKEPIDSKANSSNSPILLTITQGSFNQNHIKQDFDIDIPHTNFNAKLSSALTDNTLKYNFLLNSNMGHITSLGTIDTKTSLTNGSYDIKLDNLNALTPLVGRKIRGSLNTSGIIRGDKNQITISGKSNIAESSSSYDILLADLALKEINFDIKRLKVEKLLYMLYQPPYITGTQDSQGKIWDFNNGISIQSTQSFRGRTNNAAFREFLKMPNTTFNSSITSDIQKGSGQINFKLDSAIAQIAAPNITINLHKKNIKAPYEIMIPDLKKLQFLTDIALYGAIKANGTINLQDSLKVDLHTTNFGGELKAMLEDKDLKISLVDLDLGSLLKIVQYPQVFNAKMNGEILYNLASQSGKLKATLSNGKILKNTLTDALYEYSKFDATNVIFDDIRLTSRIKKHILISDLAIKSNDFSIDGDTIIVDLGQSTIQALLKVALKNNRIGINLNGNINAPQIQFDLTDFIKDQASNIIKQLDTKPKDALKKLQGLLK